MNKFQRRFTLGVTDVDGAPLTLSTPLSLDFQITASISGSVNSGIFRIHGLKESTRRRIYKDYFTPIQYRSLYLSAGYDDHPPVVFKGNLVQAYSVRMEGSVDHITVLEGFDGGYAFNNAKSAFTMPAGSTVAQAIGQMSLDLVNFHVTPGQFSDFKGVYRRGKTIFGPTVQMLQAETGGKFFICNERVYCLDDLDAILSDIFIISLETGWKDRALLS